MISGLYSNSLFGGLPVNKLVWGIGITGFTVVVTIAILYKYLQSVPPSDSTPWNTAHYLIVIGLSFFATIIIAGSAKNDALRVSIWIITIILCGWCAFKIVNLWSTPQPSLIGKFRAIPSYEAKVKVIGAGVYEVSFPANMLQFDTEASEHPLLIHPTEKFVIYDVDGRVNTATDPRDPGFLVVGPDGWEYWPAYNANRKGPLKKQEHYMGLCARIGNGRLPLDDGKWMFVGSSGGTFSTKAEVGYLHFVVNDCIRDRDGSYHEDWWTDNQGGFKFKLRIQNRED